MIFHGIKYSPNDNYCIDISILFYGVLTIFTAVGNSSFIALSSSSYGFQLYLRLRDEGGPLETDPVVSGSEKAENICKDISDCGFFQMVNLCPVNSLGSNNDNSLESSSSEPTELYKLIEFKGFNSIGWHNLKEYVFTCDPLKYLHTSDEFLVYYHVSKEYNVSVIEELYKPGRFVFLNVIPEQIEHTILILAEEPARAYSTTGFNIEFHYIQMREYVEPAKNEGDDPLCKLISLSMDDPHNQYERLCAAVSKSFHFIREIPFQDLSTLPCTMENISFKTEAGKKEATERLYYERMTLCRASKWEYSHIDESSNKEELFFISRSYLTNAVYVYRRDPRDEKIYLENLWTDISIVDELNSFDFIEY